MDLQPPKEDIFVIRDRKAPDFILLPNCPLGGFTLYFDLISYRPMNWPIRWLHEP